MSIEGQIKACTEYATGKGLSIVGTYIDRAQSARTDKRPEFQRMVKDSEQHEFSGVLVFQLDRFSRNRYDSAIYRRELENNGVKIFSVKEDISEGSSGILTESMIEAFAEYFSVQLSEKVSRGMLLNAEKCKYNGGNLTLGFKIDSEKNFQLDEFMAPIIRNVFERYANGETMVSICDHLNDIGAKTSRGNKFAKNSLQSILRNEKYIGTYKFGDIEIPNGIPRIVSDELFEKVQARLATDKRKSGGSYKAEERFILTGKLYCGYCKHKMVGKSGTSRNGTIHRYYTCHAGKDGNMRCRKKNVKKDWIEEKIANDCYAMLTDEIIDVIAERTVLFSEDKQAEKEINRMERLVKEKEQNIEALMDNLESGLLVERIAERIKKREKEINQLKIEIAKEKKKLWALTADEVSFFLHNLKAGNIKSEKYKKIFIDNFIDKIYLYDDEYDVLFKFGENDEDETRNEKLATSLQDVRISNKAVYQNVPIRTITFTDADSRLQYGSIRRDRSGIRTAFFFF